MNILEQCGHKGEVGRTLSCLLRMSTCGGVDLMSRFAFFWLNVGSSKMFVHTNPCLWYGVCVVGIHNVGGIKRNILCKCLCDELNVMFEGRISLYSWEG